MSFKKMNFILPFLAIIFVLSGAALTAYITYNFRKQNIANQKNIENLNRNIEEIVTKSNNLNNDILQITNNTKNLTENIQVVSNNIEIVQNELKGITQETSKIVDRNLSLTLKTTELANNIIDLQTGGKSMFFFHCWIDKEKKMVKFTGNLSGGYSMKNVNVKIYDNITIKGESVDAYEFSPVNKYGSILSYKKVIVNDGSYLNIDLGEIKKGTALSYLTSLDLKYHKDKIFFTIIVESENDRSVQKIYHKDIYANELRYYSMSSEKLGESLLSGGNTIPESELDDFVNK